MSDKQTAFIWKISEIIDQMLSTKS